MTNEQNIRNEAPTPSEQATVNKTYNLDFHGIGSDYFVILIVNWLLTVVTLGLYYPWAKAKQIKYLYGATSLNNNRFQFSGTGKEMFIGFLKLIVFLFLLGLIAGIFAQSDNPVFAVIIIYVLLIGLIPFAIHGSYRYRMSRSSWRGIRFGYRGNRGELVKIYLIGILLTLITLGIYGSWFEIKLRKYLLSNIRFGNAEFEYNGNGFDYFLLNIKGFFLTLITLGIYSFWWEKDMFNYLFDNLRLKKQDDQTAVEFRSKATGGNFFALEIINLLILIFTLGIGYAWVTMRTMRFLIDKLELNGDIDLDSLIQTEEEYTEAMGDSTADFFDIDLIF